MPAKEHDILGVYLNDHLAGSTLGTELARRVAASAQHLPVPGNVMREFAAEAAADRVALLKIMAALGVQVRGYKAFAAWAGEKLGRLKLNGHLLRRSPLSSLEELEILRLGVQGKGSGWRTLRALAERDSRLDAGQLDDLIARADRQADLLEELRAATVGRVFPAREPALPAACLTGRRQRGGLAA
jgi:hypothetical protein